MANGVNIDNYDIAAIERKMQQMSSKTANSLGESQKKAPVKKDEKKKKG